MNILQKKIDEAKFEYLREVVGEMYRSGEDKFAAVQVVHALIRLGSREFGRLVEELTDAERQYLEIQGGNIERAKMENKSLRATISLMGPHGAA